MSNEKYNAAAAGLTLAAIDGAQMTIESLRKDREYLSNELAAARLEIAELEVRVWQCGAGAGCCAQAARIEKLEAQLDAVGAGGVQRIAGPDTTAAAIGTESERIMFEQWLASEQPAGCVSDMWRGWLAGAALASQFQPAAQAQDARQPLTED